MPCRPPSRRPPQSATSTGPNANAAQTPEKDQPGSDEQLKADQQRRDLKEALQLGVQSAPKVEKLADESALLLEENKPDEALPKQQEALKLLKDMLPKQQQKEEEKKGPGEEGSGKKRSRKRIKIRKIRIKRTRIKKIKTRKKKKDQQQKEQDKKDQGKQDQNKQDQQKKDETKNQQQQNQQQQRDLNKEKAEAILQKARQRQDEHREVEKKLEGYLYRPEKVEKDW